MYRHYNTSRIINKENLKSIQQLQILDQNSNYYQFSLFLSYKYRTNITDIRPKLLLF